MGIVSFMSANALAHAEPRRISSREYRRMAELGFFEGERVELVHGTVVRMSPIGPAHADPVDLLTEVLVLALAGRARVRVQQPLLAADDSEPEPDVAVVPLRRHAREHPHEAYLVVEVADSSLLYDRETKVPLYAASGVPEVWIVDVGARAIEVYTGLTGGRYADVTRHELGEVVRPKAFPEVEVAVSEVFPDAPP